VDCFYCMPSTRSFSNLLYDIFCHVMYHFCHTAHSPLHRGEHTAHTGKSFGGLGGLSGLAAHSVSEYVVHATHTSAVHKVSRYTQSWPRAGVSGYHTTRAHGKHGRCR